MIATPPARDLAGEALDVVVVGAGIVGLAAAHKLQQAGRGVALVDRRGIARETSFGNAGGLAFSDILPLAVSGKLRKVPGWLVDPLGPLAIPPAYLPRILPWLARFWRAGWPDRVKAGTAAQSALMRLSAAEMDRLVDDCGLGTMLRKDGSLELYGSEAALAAAEPGWRARADEGIAFEHLRGERLAALQPGLSPRFVAGTFVPSWRSVSDPYGFAVALAAGIAGRGGRFATGEVAALAPAEGLARTGSGGLPRTGSGGGVRVTLDDGTVLTAAAAVLAAGAWSKRLAAPLGDPVPLETERGYNTTLPPGAFDLRLQLIFGEHGFVVSAVDGGIRVGGAVELAGLDLPPDYRRAEAMLKKAAAFLPGLRTEGGTPWMGFRPSLPDSLPVIGPSRASPHIVHAFGHGHLGLTQSAGTGRLVADLLSGRPPAIDLAPFSPRRF